MRSNVSTLPICREQLRAAHGCAVTEQAVHISDSSGIYPLLISSSSFLPSILFGSVRRDHDADSCCVSTLYILKFSKNFAPFDHLPISPLASSCFLPLPLSLLSLLFFFFSSNLLFHISTMAPRIFYKSVLCCCFCNCNLPFCLFLLFSFSFHFYSLLLVLLSHACAQSWLKIFCFQTDVLWQHLKRAGDLGQWATHVSCIHPALGIPPFYSSVFPDLSFTNSASCRGRVTGSPCKYSSGIDRKVRNHIDVQNTSAEAQLTRCQPSPPLHRPATLCGALSFICLQIAFPPCSHSWKAGVLTRFHWLLWRTSPSAGFLKTQQDHHEPTLVHAIT